MSLQRQLLEFGLTEKESAFYLSALELGRASLTDVTAKADINRSTGYQIVSSLKNKGLIETLVRKKRRYYLAADPDKLQRLVDQKSALLKHILPQLKGMSNFLQKKPRVSFYEGESGLVSIFLDNLSANNEILSIAGEQTFNALVLEKIPDYIRQRVERKILLRLIVPESDVMRKWQASDQVHLRVTKLIPKEKFSLKVNIDIYNDKIAITSPDEMVGLIIESRDIADSLKTIFNFMWSLI